MPNELRRAGKELAFKCAHLVCYQGEKNLDHPDFFPYYEAAQELDIPLFCHPNGNWGFITERFNNFLAMHVLGRLTNCTQALVVLEPERDYEGGHLPRMPSVRGLVSEPVCRLRDPAIFREPGYTDLLYAVAGERGIAIAELTA
jgi:hypothetical protein